MRGGHRRAAELTPHRLNQGFSRTFVNSLFDLPWGTVGRGASGETEGSRGRMKEKKKRRHRREEAESGGRTIGCFRGRGEDDTQALLFFSSSILGDIWMCAVGVK